MVSPRPKTKLTYEDYAKTPDDERWELIDGELFRMPSPNIAHQMISGELFPRMKQFVQERNLGVVFHAPTDVVLSDTDTVEPDLLFISRERMGIITRLNIQGAPDLVVEIHSSSTTQRDLTAKRALYARSGVKEYWPVDLRSPNRAGPVVAWRRFRGSRSLQGRRCRDFDPRSRALASGRRKYSRPELWPLPYPLIACLGSPSHRFAI